jgi:RNA polymerase sigma-70 factor (ECF subfamily)
MEQHQASAERQQELQLLSAVLEGDRRASRSFFERYNCTIEMCVRKVLRNNQRRPSDEDVRDLVADVWLALMEDDKRPLRRFDPARRIRVATWVGLLARNKAIDRLRGRQDHAVSLEQPLGDNDVPAEAPLPSEQIEAQEEQRLAREALARLSPADRAFLEAWYLEKNQPGELAKRFGISVGTVYSRRFKIQAKLARSVGLLTRQKRRRTSSITIH